jgi:hypothetical protein
MSGDRAFPARIVKADHSRQLAYGVVLEPRTADNPDTQGDWYTAEDIEKAAHGFLEAVAKGEGGADLMHAEDGNGPLIGVVVETYIAPVDFVWGEGANVEVVKAGSWVLGCHYPDPDIWSAVVKGELGAFSVSGKGWRVFA